MRRKVGAVCRRLGGSRHATGGSGEGQTGSRWALTHAVCNQGKVVNGDGERVIGERVWLRRCAGD